MPKKLFKKPNAKLLVALLICIGIVVSTPFMIVRRSSASAKDRDKMLALTVWQIDCFEGGKGSRASYLRSLAEEFSKENDCYIQVTSLSSEAARLNLENESVPDMISYGAGMCGIESFISGKQPYVTWCYGSYCLLTLQENCDFADVTPENTVINRGTENLSGAAALMLGLQAAVSDKPTGAYLKLLNGSYKYLLGTQRDVYRLITRGAAFCVKPVEIFNDLYQNISVTAKSAERRALSEKFIKFILNNSGRLTKIGLMPPSKEKIFDNEMKALEGIEYRYKLNSPVSAGTREEIGRAIINNDENKLKNLLK